MREVHNLKMQYLSWCQKEVWGGGGDRGAIFGGNTVYQCEMQRKKTADEFLN